MSQRCAGAAQDLGQFMGTLLSTTFTAMAPTRLLAIRLLQREQTNQDSNIIPLRASFSSPPPITLNAAAIRHVGEACVVYNNIHSHCPTCRKGDRGQTACRLAYCRPCSENFTPREIRVVAIISELNNSTINVPRARELILPEDNRMYDQYEGIDDSHRLNEHLFRLSSPGFDDRLIEYPLQREFVHADLNAMNLEDGDRQTISRELLMRLYDRLLNICQSLSMNIEPIPMNCSLANLNTIVNTALQSLLLGRHDSNNTLLVDDDVIAYVKRIFSSNERMINFLDYLSLQNSLIGETNLAISASVGSNFNAQPLVSQEAAMAAIFYIIDYITKDSMNPADLLGFIQAARLRFQNFPGQAPANENVQDNSRPARRLGQIVQNGIAGAVEISVQQCVLNIAGLPSHDSSENFTFIFTRSAIRAMRLSIAEYISRASGSDENQRPAIDADSDRPPPIRRRRILSRNTAAVDIITRTTAPLLPETVDPFAAIDFDYANNMPTVGTTHRNRQNILVSTCQDLEYLHRGEELAFLSLVEYACSVNRITIERDDDNEVTVVSPEHVDEQTNSQQQSGRLPNATYLFGLGYPLRDIFQQRLKSLQSIPIFGGISSVPTWPNFRTISRHNNTSEDEDNNFEREQNTFAEYVLVMFRPWAAPGHVHPNHEGSFIQQLHVFLNELEEGIYLKDNITDIYHAPTGYQNTIQRNTANSAAFAFSQRCKARFIG